MAGMLTVTSRNIPRSAFRLLNNYLEKCVTEVPVKHRAYHQGLRTIRKTTTRCNSSILSRPQSVCCREVRYFRSSAAFFNESEIVTVPPFADSVSEGDVRWEKKKGDEVAEDDVVLEIETDKTSVPVPAPASGIIEEIYVEDGATVKAGQNLFKLKVTGVAPAKAAPAPAAKTEAPPAAAPPPVAAAPPTPKPQGIVLKLIKSVCRFLTPIMCNQSRGVEQESKRRKTREELLVVRVTNCVTKYFLGIKCSFC